MIMSMNEKIEFLRLLINHYQIDRAGFLFAIDEIIDDLQRLRRIELLVTCGLYDKPMDELSQVEKEIKKEIQNRWLKEEKNID